MQIKKPESLKKVLRQLRDLRKLIQTNGPEVQALTDEQVLDMMEQALARTDIQDLAYYATLMSYATSDPIMEHQMGAILDEVCNEKADSG